MSIITTQNAHGLALSHAAETMLRTLGGIEVCVRFAIPTTAATAEFGIATSSIADIRISPVIVRNAGSTASSRKQAANAPLSSADEPAGSIEFLLPAAAVDRAAQLDGYSSAVAWFAHALGIVLNDELHAIASIATENFAGQPYLYRITTR
jgi:hypothetical protein